MPNSAAAAGSGSAVSLRSLAIRGSIWTVLGYAGGQVLRLAGNLVLTRLLFPEAFGLMALVQVFMQGLAMFSDIGIGPSIIQNPRGEEPRFLNTAWTIQVGRGAILSLCALLLGWPVAQFYGEPQLAALLPVAGLSALIAGFNSTRLFTCNRRLALGRLTMVELLAQAVGLTLTVLWAWHSRTVWSLVFGGLIGAVVKTILTHAMLPGERNGFCWDSTSRKELFGFGKWIFVSTLTTFLAAQSDRLVFGKLISLEMLGVYSIAFMLATMPTQVMLRIGSTVVFPLYSNIVRRDGALREVYLRVRSRLMAAGAWLVAVLIASGPSLVRFLYDDRYYSAGWMLQLLAVASWFQILECTNGSALLAMGRPRWVAAGNVMKLIGIAGLMILGYFLAGFPGAVGGLVAAELLKYATSAAGVHRQRLAGPAHDLAWSALTAAGATLGILLGQWLGRRGAGDGAVVLSVSGLLAIVWCGAMLVALRKAGWRRW